MAVVVFLVQQEVLRLDVAMANRVGVQVAQGVESLLHDRTSLRLGEMLFLGDVVKQFAAFAQPKIRYVRANLLCHEETYAISLPSFE